MCNEYRNRKSIRQITGAFDQHRIPLRFQNGIPNIEPADSIRITDRAPIIVPDGDGVRVEMMRWSWPSPTGAPVFNFRSEKRRFNRSQRCLIPADGFYEFTSSGDQKRKRKDKWLFTLKGDGIFAIAGIWRTGAPSGEDAWTMLTCEPGADIAPYHNRQVVVLPPERWAAWIMAESNETELLVPSPEGSFNITGA